MESFLASSYKPQATRIKLQLVACGLQLLFRRSFLLTLTGRFEHQAKDPNKKETVAEIKPVVKILNSK